MINKIFTSREFLNNLTSSEERDSCTKHAPELILTFNDLLTTTGTVTPEIVHKIISPGYL